VVDHLQQRVRTEPRHLALKIQISQSCADDGQQNHKRFASLQNPPEIQSLISICHVVERGPRGVLNLILHEFMLPMARVLLDPHRPNCSAGHVGDCVLIKTQNPRIAIEFAQSEPICCAETNLEKVGRSVANAKRFVWHHDTTAPGKFTVVYWINIQ
jgi:hypothetical protein